MPDPTDSSSAPAVEWTPSPRELDDLDLLTSGCLLPDVTGFVDPSNAGPAREITLAVSPEVADLAAASGLLRLVDPEGAPLATMRVDATYPAPEGRTGLVGPVAAAGGNVFGPFRSLYLTPAAVHAGHPADALLAVPVDRPLGGGDLELIRAEAAGQGRIPLLLTCVGHGRPRRISVPGLIRATRAAAASLPGALVAAVSIADHGDAEADAWLTRTVAGAFASSTLDLPWSEPADLPAEVAAIVRHERPPRHEQGVVFFFTGLSGSGKSTLARALMDHLLEQGIRTVTSLDGDVVRHHLSKGLGFSREDRETNIVRIGFVAAEIARHGGVAICSPIAPFESTRSQVCRMVEEAGGGFALIHVATPLEECERRDRKGLYAKARAGVITDFTGISSPYEEPTESIKVDTTNRDIAECLEEILEALTAEGWLQT